MASVKLTKLVTYKIYSTKLLIKLQAQLKNKIQLEDKSSCTYLTTLNETLSF